MNTDVSVVLVLPQLDIQRSLDALSSMHSLSVLLSVFGRTCTTTDSIASYYLWYNTNSPMVTVRNHSHKFVRAMFTSHGYYSRAALFHSRASDCAPTIRWWPLFEGGVYSKKYGFIHRTATYAVGNIQ